MLFLLPLALLLAQQPAPDPEDPGPPVLKRGGNAPRKAPPPGPDVKSVKIPPPLPDDDPAAIDRPRPVQPAATAATTGDDLIYRAQQAAYAFDEGLPNFICDQLTMRSESNSGRVPNWKMRDRVEVELLYVDRKEDYRNPRVNGKPLKKGTPEDSGQWSTGDFGTLLVDILAPTTAAKFKKRAGATERIGGIETIAYDYTVEQANSHWTIRMGSEIKPAYKGTLFIDPESARVMRIEMQARQLPVTYQMDTIEVTTEYGFTTIGGQKYLLPVKSENLACQRYTNRCARNEIEYRNYRRFTAESSISTTDSTINFEGAEPPKPATPPVKKK